MNDDARVLDDHTQELQEWRSSVSAMLRARGTDVSTNILRDTLQHARSLGLSLQTFNTDYINTIHHTKEPQYPGDEELERTFRKWVRWNAVCMVQNAQKPDIQVGGHMSTYASIAHLYEVGFNHFFKGYDHPEGPDQIFFQGHASPGNYARSFLEGRISDRHLAGFRQEFSHEPFGISSYPHPKLMQDYWQFPTVSMGLGPINAIWQAHFNKYITNRGIKDASGSRVWAFLGDGEMDEVESRGQLQFAAAHELDNLIFVINCNLQGLDGPVRGGGKIIQELEAFFAGAGWNVIKVIWGRDWDPLLDTDTNGALVDIMNSTPDGDFQTFRAEDGDFVRKNFFGKHPDALKLVENYPDEKIWRLRRGGHDTKKIYAAYSAACNHKGSPTVILAHTIKGYALGEQFASRNATHSMKKLDAKEIKLFRDYLEIPIQDSELSDIYNLPFYTPPQSHPAMQYILQKRQQLGGTIPQRRSKYTHIPLPKESVYEPFLGGSANTPIATTMGFVRLLKELLASGDFGKRIVPIIPDEARTFGMESFFATHKIYNPKGQRYTAVDRKLLLNYKEATDGQIVHVGINEAGAVAALTAAGTSYSTLGEPAIPVYIFYSMFGFQRTADAFWAATDCLTRGFIIGATAGKTTLSGEGLQHMDGASHIYAGVNPAVMAWDPAYVYEIAHIVRFGIERMYGGEHSDPDVLFYITVYNEPIAQLPQPKDLNVRDLLQGMYVLSPDNSATIKHPVCDTVQILASGPAVPQALEAQRILADSWNVPSRVFSVTSWSQLRRDGQKVQERNWLEPLKTPQIPFITKQLAGCKGIVLGVTDYNHSLADMPRPFIEQKYITLGGDGFGISDTRKAARRFFKIDTESMVVRVLSELSTTGHISTQTAQMAKDRYFKV